MGLNPSLHFRPPASFFLLLAPGRAIHFLLNSLQSVHLCQQTIVYRFTDGMGVVHLSLPFGFLNLFISLNNHAFIDYYACSYPRHVCCTDPCSRYTH